MANFFKQLLDTLKLQDDDESFAAYENSVNSKRRAVEAPSSGKSDFSSKRSSSSASAPASSSRPAASTGDGTQVKKAHSASNYGTSTYIESRNNSKTLRMERPEGSKVVPIKTTRDGLEVCVMKPKNFEDSQDICDVLLSNCVAIVNLEDNDIVVSQRIMDFISGAVYSVNGKLFQISDLIFIAAPGTVDVSGDYNDILAQTGYDVPLLSKSM
ncbi:MAG: cell division protein SepF [Lachnospiraceae bacterium]|nr:cell division protein SepF [Lachnospiraceae bacterium]